MAVPVAIEVNVPSTGLSRYEFMGAGYTHNEMVPDRRLCWPVSRGIPFPKGTMKNVNTLALRDAVGNLVPRQVRPLATWPDETVMFALLEWQATVGHNAPQQYSLELVGGMESPLPEHPVAITESNGRIIISNGPLHAAIRRDAKSPSLSLTLNEHRIFNGPIEMWATDGHGVTHDAILEDPQSIRIIEAGPLVGIIEISGTHKSKTGDVFLEYVLRLRFDAGRAELNISHTFANMGKEPDGVAVGEIGLRLPQFATTDIQRIVRQTHSGINSETRYPEFQENATISIDRTGTRIIDNTPFREDTSGYPPYLKKYAHHTDDWIGLRTPNWSAITFVHEARENWPKRIISQDKVLEYHLWPKAAKLQHLRQGMARTHHIQLSFFDPGEKANVLHMHRCKMNTPPNVVVPFEWYQECAVFGMENILPWMPRRYRHLEGLFVEGIERQWVTGMLNYGDDPDSGYTASYSQAGLGKDTVWINNEHDFMSQAVIQYWRTGRRNAWKGAKICAEHQIDVDFVRKSDDRWKEGGTPAHCYQHTTAAVYPSHLWTEGLLQYYLTSGDERALEAAKSIGRLICQYVEERYAALATESRMEGWALIALAALIEVTHDDRCLRAARKIERRIREAALRKGAYDSAGMNYGTGTVLTGLAHLHRITGRSETLNLLLQILDWHAEYGQNDVGTTWGDALLPYQLNLTLPAYAYAYTATRDKKYLEAGIKFLRFTGPPYWHSTLKIAAKCYRTYLPYLKVAHEAGALDEIERRMHRIRRLAHSSSIG